MRTRIFRPAPPPAGALRKAKLMNKTEARYALVLEAMKRNGDIDGYEFEGVTLKLATGVRYTPDFAVWTSTMADDAHVELHEVKGFMRDDARIKLRVAAKQYPCFSFKLCRLIKGSWITEKVE